jgi:hypothetical protein
MKKWWKEHFEIRQVSSEQSKQKKQQFNLLQDNYSKREGLFIEYKYLWQSVGDLSTELKVKL